LLNYDYCKLNLLISNFLDKIPSPGREEYGKGRDFFTPRFDHVAIMMQCNSGGNDGHVANVDGRYAYRVDVGNHHNNGGYDGDCSDAVGKTLKRATPMAMMVRWPKSVPR